MRTFKSTTILAAISLLVIVPSTLAIADKEKLTTHQKNSVPTCPFTATLALAGPNFFATSPDVSLSVKNISNKTQRWGELLTQKRYVFDVQYKPLTSSPNSDGDWQTVSAIPESNPDYEIGMSFIDGEQAPGEVQTYTLGIGNYPTSKPGYYKITGRRAFPGDPSIVSETKRDAFPPTPPSTIIVQRIGTSFVPIIPKPVN